MKKVVLSAVLSGFLVFSGLTLLAKPPVTGTCCPQIGPICVIGNFVARGYYYQSSGPCK